MNKVFTTFSGDLNQISNELERVHTRMKFYNETIGLEEVKELKDAIENVNETFYTSEQVYEIESDAESRGRKETSSIITNELNKIIDNYDGNVRKLLQDLEHCMKEAERFNQ